MEDEHLRRIDAKIGALVALEVDRVLRETNAQGAGSQSLDQLLATAGYGTVEIASMLGRSQRAVQKALKNHSDGKKSGKKRTARRKG